MTVPDFQTTMLPLLRLISDRKSLSISEAIESLAQQMKLTAAEQTEMLDSGAQTRWGNRVSWAASYLYQAGLVMRPTKGHIQITDEGALLLQNPPERITIKYLMGYPKFAAWKGKSKAVLPSSTVTAQVDEISPTELLEATYLQYRSILAHDLLAQTKQVKPAFFERLVVQLLVSMGYGGSFRDAAQAIGKSGDGGMTASSRKIALALTSSLYKLSAGKIPLGAKLSRHLLGR